MGWSRRKGVSFANYEIIEKILKRKILPRSNLEFILKLVIFSLIIFALADTVIWYEGKGTNSNIILAIDASASMLADDYYPTRLDTAKSTAIDIISTLDSETKVGVISFAGTSVIIQPITNDKFALKDSINKINFIKTGGTAIGEAIILSTNLLSTQENSKGKLLILLTDGQSNVGITSEDAIKYANQYGIIINTIGIGTEEGGKFAEASSVSQLDKKTLIKIAEATGGKFYHALTKEQLQLVLSEFFKSEKRKIGINARTHLLLLAFLLFFIDWVLANTRYKVTP